MTRALTDYFEPPAHDAFDRRLEWSALSRLESKRSAKVALCHEIVSLPVRAAAWWFPYRLLGKDTSAIRGVLSLREPAAPFEIARVAQWLLDRTGADVARLTIVNTPGPRWPDLGPVTFHVDGQGLWYGAMAEEMGDVLALGDDEDAFLARLGSHTRRNIRRAAKLAGAAGVTVRFDTAHVYAPPRKDSRILALNNVPTPFTSGEIAAFETTIAGRSRHFQSAMETKSGRLIHYCRGFIEDDVAYVLYQANDIVFREFNQSLLHRFNVARELIAAGVSQILFVSGCGGLLLNACETLASMEWVAVRPGARGVATAAALGIAFPGAWTGRTSLRLLGHLARRRLCGFARDRFRS